MSEKAAVAVEVLPPLCVPIHDNSIAYKSPHVKRIFFRGKNQFFQILQRFAVSEPAPGRSVSNRPNPGRGRAARGGVFL